MSGGLQNQLPTIGEMDELFQFAVKTETVDDWGSTQQSIIATGTDVWAKIRFINTDERDSAAKQQKFVTEIKIHIRYDSTATQYKYVYWRSNYYDIFAIETTPRSRFHVIKARLIET